MIIKAYMDKKEMDKIARITLIEKRDKTNLTFMKIYKNKNNNNQEYKIHENGKDDFLKLVKSYYISQLQLNKRIDLRIKDTQANNKNATHTYLNNCIGIELFEIV